MESHYQSQHMTVTNIPADRGSDMFFAFALAQQSSCSVIIFNSARDVVYMNNRLRTFDNADEYDKKCASTIADYMAEHYHLSARLKKHLLGIFTDYYPREFKLQKYTGEKINFKLVPVFNGTGLHGVVLFAKYNGWVI